jgi:acetyl esterase/lipase
MVMFKQSPTIINEFRIGGALSYHCMIYIHGKAWQAGGSRGWTSCAAPLVEGLVQVVSFLYPS